MNRILLFQTLEIGDADDCAIFISTLSNTCL
jgi:hypothetical protein